MIDAEQIRRFCSALFGGPDGTGDEKLADLHVAAAWSLPGKETRWRRGNDLGAIVSAITDLAEAQGTPGGPTGIYIGPGMTRAEKTRFKRAKAHDVVALPGLWADIDFAGGPHTSKPYPPDFDAAVALANAPGLVPTAIIRTGHGIQAWWLFTEPFIIEPDEDVEAEQEKLGRISQDWNSTLRYHAERLGQWKLDSVFDLARVLRVPGTLNLKVPDDPRRAEIVKLDNTRRYELDDLTERFADTEVLDSYAAGTTGIKTAEFGDLDLNRVWARANSADYRSRDYTPEWLSVVLEIDGSAGPLSLLWAGNRADLGNDPSSYDASLARILADYGFSLDHQIEAIMCRRLRTGQKVDKVDPRQRVDYLIRTIGFVAAQTKRKTKLAEFELDRDASFASFAKNKLGSTAHVEPEPDPADFLPPEPDPEDDDPGPGPGMEPDAMPDYVDAVLDHADNVMSPEQRLLAATFQVENEHQAADEDRQPPVREVPKPLPPAPDPTELDEEIWGKRSDGLRAHMEALSDLLLPEAFRAEGFEVWRLERADQGDAARGRIGLKIPVDADWPDGNRPEQYRVGRPLFSEWHKRGDFATPRGFRTALTVDCLIPAAPVGDKERWAALIDRLVPYWLRDSTGSDMASSMHGWLLDYLLDHPPTPLEVEAIDMHKPFLRDHRNWGTTGTPSIWFSLKPFLGYVATRPGGPSGKVAQSSMRYLHVTADRIRMQSANGKKVRGTWYEIGDEEFTREEWGFVIEAVRDVQLSRADRLRAVRDEGA
jgi:hypothetical protein